VGEAGQTIAAMGDWTTPTDIANLQQRLLDLGFWLSGPNGQYDWTTSQAVLAFQKFRGLPRSAKVDENTATQVNLFPCKPTAQSAAGDLIEVDKGQQLLFIVRGGQMLWTLNTSTGTEVPYTEADQLNPGHTTSGSAHTPTGTFKVYSQFSAGWEKGELGTLWRPKFFSGGVAVHGELNVPGYRASHGCVRVSNPAMDMIWAQNYMPLGSTVFVHE
jgi:lipoprotein-anchoring transpeptidase ErfK/SrfK